MTCIVGMLKDGAVYMTGDHIGTDGYDVEVQCRSKVFRNGDFIIGYTSSFRMGQILEHMWEPPKKPKECRDVLSYMVKHVVPSIIKVFDDNKFMRVSTDSDDATKRSVNGQAYGGEFLVGYREHLFKIQSDFAVLECVKPFDSIGAGEDFAKGAFEVLYQLNYLYQYDAKTLLKSILSSVEEQSALVKVDWEKFQVLTTAK